MKVVYGYRIVREFLLFFCCCLFWPVLGCWLYLFIYLLEGDSFSTSAEKKPLLIIRIGTLVANPAKKFLKEALAQNIPHASTST